LLHIESAGEAGNHTNWVLSFRWHSVRELLSYTQLFNNQPHN